MKMYCTWRARHVWCRMCVRLRWRFTRCNNLYQQRASSSDILGWTGRHKTLRRCASAVAV